MEGLAYLPLAFGLGPMELGIILAIVIILFGASRIPQLMRGVGRGVVEFKSGMEEAKNMSSGDDKKEVKDSDKKELEASKEE